MANSMIMHMYYVVYKDDTLRYVTANSPPFVFSSSIYHSLIFGNIVDSKLLAQNHAKDPTFLSS